MRTTDSDKGLASAHDVPSAEYRHHSTAHRVNTDVIILNAIQQQYPQKHVTISPEYGCNSIDYAAAGQ